MKPLCSQKTLSAGALAFAATFTFNVYAFAQHGGGHPAGLGGPGIGGASIGAGAVGGARADTNIGGRSLGVNANANTNAMGHASLGSQSPRAVLSSNTKLDSSLTTALGKSGISVPGGNLQSTCAAFKNLGQCVAALHVSKNLGIPFIDLQAKMTGSGSESLGKAIQDLGGANVNSKAAAKAEVKKASKQANADLDAAGSAS
jgi:hypothetical protein